MGVDNVGRSSSSVDLSKKPDFHVSEMELPQQAATKPPSRSLISRMTGYSATKHPDSELRNLLVRKFGTDSEKKAAQNARLDRKIATSQRFVAFSPFKREAERHRGKIQGYEAKKNALNSTVSYDPSHSASSSVSNFSIQKHPTIPDPGEEGYGAWV